MTSLQQRYADAARREGLLVPEYRGSGMGIGTREELETLIAGGVLPKGTTLRQPRPEDF